MAGARTSIAEQLKNAAVGNDVAPDKQTVQAEAKTDSESSRQNDEKTNSLPSLPPVAVFALPPGLDSSNRLAYCEAAILYADHETELETERITQQYLLWVGEPYRLVRDEELFREAGYETFDAWGRALNGRSGDYMNKVIRIAPVVQALASVTRRQLKEQPLRPLVSVQRQHGDDAVRECWRKAEAAGDLTERGLRAAAVDLGYRTAPEPATPVPSPRTTPSAVVSLDRLKRLAARDPERARALCRSLRDELDAIERGLAPQD
ncbi:MULTISPECIES: hypothetical protein [Streptomyces]|uniref:Uncharacterized protein n=2 Tax=Streptomyces TaxID=1883 RepID=A0ABU4KE91_9ACTN|nr:hypothetical protein [Streptomyces roseolus]MDX2295879.1 hypothetical protein [Streptomyces roseolus]